MPLPKLIQSMHHFKDPWKTLIEIVDENIGEDFFEQVLITGKNPEDELTTLHAWSIVGFVPGYRGPLECNSMITAMSETEDHREFWISEMKDVVEEFNVKGDYDPNRILNLSMAVQEELGRKIPHVLGMLSIHQIKRNNHLFSVLWKNPSIGILLVKRIMKHVLNKSLIEKKQILA